MEFRLGDLVLPKLQTLQPKALRNVNKGLMQKYERLFPVIERVENVAYCLKLQSTLNIHPMFHESLLKPYHNDGEDASRRESLRAPLLMFK